MIFTFEVVFSTGLCFNLMLEVDINITSDVVQEYFLGENLRIINYVVGHSRASKKAT